MIQIDTNSFLKAFNAADENKKELMRNSRINDCILGSSIKMNIDTDSKSLILLFGYKILGLIDSQTLYRELKVLGINDAEAFATTVLSCVEVTNTPSSPHTIHNEETSVENKSKIQTTTPHIRTMADDMAKSQAAGEHVYTSTQEAILKEGWSTPKPAQNPPQSS